MKRSARSTTITSGLGLRWFDLVRMALVLSAAVEFVRSMRQLPGPSL